MGLAELDKEKLLTEANSKAKKKKKKKRKEKQKEKKEQGKREIKEKDLKPISESKKRILTYKDEEEKVTDDEEKGNIDNEKRNGRNIYVVKDEINNKLSKNNIQPAINNYIKKREIPNNNSFTEKKATSEYLIFNNISLDVDTRYITDTDIVEHRRTNDLNEIKRHLY